MIRVIGNIIFSRSKLVAIYVLVWTSLRTVIKKNLFSFIYIFTSPVLGQIGSVIVYTLCESDWYIGRGQMVNFIPGCLGGIGIKKKKILLRATDIRP